MNNLVLLYQPSTSASKRCYGYEIYRDKAGEPSQRQNCEETANQICPVQNFLRKISPATQLFCSLFLSSTVSETDSHSQHVSRNRLVLPPSQVRKGFSPVVSDSFNILHGIHVNLMALEKGGLAQPFAMTQSLVGYGI